MEYPRLRKALNAYCAWIQSGYKGAVQVRTGRLKNSIRVFCTVDGKQYKMNLDLMRYWKWIPEAFPWDKVLEAAGLEPEKVRYKYWADTSFRRYSFLHELDKWSELLNNAFKEDIETYLGLKVNVTVNSLKK